MEINPQSNIVPEYPSSNFDPCLNINRPPYYQSVYSCSSYPVEPFQQMFPWQSGSYMGQFDSTSIYNIEIIYGTEYAYLYKAAHWDSVLQDMTEPEYYGSSLTGLTGSELSGTGEYEVFQWVGIYERKHPSYYEIRFDNFAELEANVIVRITNLNTSLVTEWHSTIVNPQFALVNLEIAGDTVLHKRAVEVTPELDNVLQYTCHHFGYGSCPPDNITFGIEILEGEGYGTIGRYDRNYEFWDYSNSFTNLSYDDIYSNYLFYYQATGQQPDSTAVVKIRQSSSDADIGNIDYTFYVKRNFLPPVSENGSIVIETNKNTAMPGDTLDILLKWEDGSNGIVDFEEWQEFAVWLADGFSYGTLLDPATNDTSDSFEVIGKELKLIVHQNVTDANKKIVIAAETEVALLGGASRMQSKNENHTERKEIKSYKADITQDKEDKEGGGPTIDLLVGSQYLSGVKEIIVNPFIVEIDPPTVSAGDTARIIPKYMNENGNYVEFDSLQTFELGMLDGCALGKLSNAGIDTNYFYEVKQPFYFIADSSADSGIVSIRVGVIEMNPQNRSVTNNNQPQPVNPVTFCFLNTYQTKQRFIDVPLPIEKKYEILLGETKYYAVKKKTETGELKIEEIKTDYGNEPKFPADADGWEWQKADVWGEAPATIVEGDILCIYWEKEKPVWNGSTKKGNTSKGIIRLVGKYWDEVKLHKAKLTAKTQDGKTASITIDITKPDKLGPDVVENINFINFNDVFGNSHFINKYCIQNSGQEGIPPQLIKAQAFKEAKFKPSYRYEPWIDLSFLKPKNKERYLKQGNTFVVTEEPMSMGLGISVPSNHSNVGDANYLFAPTKCAEIIARDLRSRYWVTKDYRCVNDDDGHDITDQFHKYYINPNISQKEESKAIARAIDSVKRDLRDGKLERYNFIAQSRIVASYNPFQQTYYNAVDWELHNFRFTEQNYSPEMLNEPDHQFVTYVSRIKKVLSKSVKSSFPQIIDYDSNNWSLGYEGTWYAYLLTYNGKKSYRNDVMKYYKIFTPKKEN